MEKPRDVVGIKERVLIVEARGHTAIRQKQLLTAKSIQAGLQTPAGEHVHLPHKAAFISVATAVS